MEQEFITKCRLGQGSFGQVYKVVRISDNKQYAMKKVKIENMKQKQRKNALNEIRLLASIQHPNIISYKQAFYDPKSQSLCTVMQLATNGDLYNRLKSKFKKGQYFKQEQVWRIGYQILKGLNILHDMKILHRDLKPANIFFGNNDVAKLGDMNVSRILQDGGLAKTQIGTPFYASPQLWNNQPYSYECDIWSFGCILYELCCFRPPFKGKDLDELYKKVMKCKYETIPSRYSKKINHAIEMCLKVKERSNTKNLLQFFVDNIQNKEDLKSNVGSFKIIEDIKLPANWKQYEKILPKPKYISEKTISLKKIERRKNIKEYLCNRECENLIEEKISLQHIKSAKCLKTPEQGIKLQARKSILMEAPSLVQFQRNILREDLKGICCADQENLKRRNILRRIFE